MKSIVSALVFFALAASAEASSLECRYINPSADLERPQDVLESTPRITIDFEKMTIQFQPSQQDENGNAPVVVKMQLDDSDGSGRAYKFNHRGYRWNFYRSVNPTLIRVEGSDLIHELHYILTYDGPGMHEDYLACRGVST